MPTPSDLALCRSALYEALALGFHRPTPETVARLAVPEGAAALAAAARVLDAEWGSALASAAWRLAHPASLGTLSVAYDRLFGHTARGVIPPYGTEYGEDSLFQPMHEMSDLAAFYRGFGLCLHPQAHERPDHISCECEFLAFLARKEVYAREHDDQAMLGATQEAARRFLRDHLGRWGPAFGRRLAREEAGAFFGNLGELCTDFLTRECSRVEVPVGPEMLRVRSTPTSQLRAACGDPDDLVETHPAATGSGPR